ncbi:MAG: hypothetical protein ACXVAX_07215 [Pseudobdellovibrio sp.]
MSLKFKVVSDSMFPVIKIGDELSFNKKEVYNIFDIILFKRHGDLIVHFVWRDQMNFNNTLITRSLKNFNQDEEPVKIEEVLGTVDNFKIPFLTKIKIYFSSRMSFH